MLALHIQAWTPGALDAAIRAGGPVLKVMAPDVDPIARVLAAHPNTAIICRDFAEPSEQEQYLNDGEIGGSRWAHRVVDRFAAVIQYCRSVGATVYVEALNEPPCWPDYDAKADLNNRFTLGFVAACTQRKVLPCVLNLPTGNPPGDEATIAYIWRKLVPALRATKAAGGALGLHEYSAPAMQEGASWLCLRYRRAYAALPEDLQDLPLLITECGIDGGVLPNPPPPGSAGWKNFASADEYAAQLEWYANELRKDGRVIGATIFTAGSMGWDSFDVTHCEPVLNLISRLRTAPPPPPVVPPVVPQATHLVLPMRAVDDIVKQLGALWGWSYEFSCVTNPADEAIRACVVAIKDHLAEGVQQ